MVKVFFAFFFITTLFFLSHENAEAAKWGPNCTSAPADHQICPSGVVPAHATACIDSVNIVGGVVQYGLTPEYGNVEVTIKAAANQLTCSYVQCLKREDTQTITVTPINGEASPATYFIDTLGCSGGTCDDGLTVSIASINKGKYQSCTYYIDTAKGQLNQNGQTVELSGLYFYCTPPVTTNTPTPTNTPIPPTATPIPTTTPSPTPVPPTSAPTSTLPTSEPPSFPTATTAPTSAPTSRPPTATAPPGATPTSVPCAVATTPGVINLPIGGTGVITATVTSGLGIATIDQMRFGSYNTAIATISPTSDASSPYQTTVTKIAAGSTAVWATADLSDGRTCQSTGITDTDIVPPTNTPTLPPGAIATPTSAPPVCGASCATNPNVCTNIVGCDYCNPSNRKCEQPPACNTDCTNNPNVCNLASGGCTYCNPATNRCVAQPSATPTPIPACNTPCSNPSACIGAQDGCTVCGPNNRCVPPPTATPTPPPFDESMCSCDQLTYTKPVTAGKKITVTAFGKVVGINTNYAKIPTFTFNFFQSSRGSTSANKLASAIVNTIQIESTPQKARYQAIWNLQVPANVSSRQTYRIQAVPNCVKKSAYLFNPETVVLGSQTTTTNQGLFSRVFAFFAGLFGHSQTAVSSLPVPTPTFALTQKKNLQLQTFRPATLVSTDNCSFIKFSF